MKNQRVASGNALSSKVTTSNALPPPAESMLQSVTSAKRRFAAFTLIELLIVVTIIGILTGFGILAFNTFNRRQALAQAAKNLKTDIRAARNQAVSGVNGKRWGVHFDQGSPENYEIFSVSDDPAITIGVPGFAYDNASEKQLKVLPSGVEVSDLCSPLDTCGRLIANVVFDRLTGEVGVHQNDGTVLGREIKITLSISGVADRYVKVEAGGKIYEE